MHMLLIFRIWVSDFFDPFAFCKFSDFSDFSFPLQQKNLVILLNSPIRFQKNFRFLQLLDPTVPKTLIISQRECNFQDFFWISKAGVEFFSWIFLPIVDWNVASGHLLKTLCPRGGPQAPSGPLLFFCFFVVACLHWYENAQTNGFLSRICGNSSNCSSNWK